MMWKRENIFEQGERLKSPLDFLSEKCQYPENITKVLELELICRRLRDMTKIEIDPGICGFIAEVTAAMDNEMCSLDINCDCEPIQEMAKELKQVDPMVEMGFFREGPLTLRMFAKHCPHPSCPVPTGILKSVEVEAGLALPKDASIKVIKE